VEGVVKMWLSSQAADFFDTGMQKLILQYDECLNSGGVNAYILCIIKCVFSLLVMLTIHQSLLLDFMEAT
jgi:hypothetical protein